GCDVLDGGGGAVGEQYGSAGQEAVGGTGDAVLFLLLRLLVLAFAVLVGAASPVRRAVRGAGELTAVGDLAEGLDHLDDDPGPQGQQRTELPQAVAQDQGPVPLGKGLAELLADQEPPGVLYDRLGEAGDGLRGVGDQRPQPLDGPGGVPDDCGEQRVEEALHYRIVDVDLPGGFGHAVLAGGQVQPVVGRGAAEDAAIDRRIAFPEGVLGAGGAVLRVGGLIWGGSGDAGIPGSGAGVCAVGGRRRGGGLASVGLGAGGAG